MGFSVWVVHGRNSSEEIARDKPEQVANSIANHPSNSGRNIIVVPSWGSVPLGRW